MTSKHVITSIFLIQIVYVLYNNSLLKKTKSRYK